MPPLSFTSTLVSIHFPLSWPRGEGAGGGFRSVLPPVLTLQLLDAGAVSGCASSPRPAPEPVTAGEQGPAAGPAELQVRAGFAFVQAIRKGALVAQRELKASP